MKHTSIKIGLCAFALLLLAGCDEGKIYPDETIDTGRTATVTLKFKNIGAWPRKNYLSFAAFGKEKEMPLLVKRIIEPINENEEETITLNGLQEETTELAIAIISNGQKLVYTYYSFAVNDEMEHITVPVESVDMASFDRIQQQIFNQNCIACHGGSTSIASNLNLTQGKAYISLVNVDAPMSPDKEKYVQPGSPSNSYLLDILQNNSYHKDMFNSSGKQEVLNLIKTWIQQGAPNN